MVLYEVLLTFLGPFKTDEAASHRRQLKERFMGHDFHLPVKHLLSLREVLQYIS